MDDFEDVDMSAILIHPNGSNNSDHILRLLGVYQILFSSQVKRSVIISTEHGVYTSCLTSCQTT